MRLRAPDEPEAENSYEGDALLISAPSTPEHRSLPPLDVGSPEYIEERLENLKRRPNWADFLDQYVQEHPDSDSEDEAASKWEQLRSAEAPGLLRSTLWSLLVVGLSPMLLVCSPCLRHKGVGFWPLGCRSMKDLFYCAAANVTSLAFGVGLLYWTICRELPDLRHVGSMKVALDIKALETQRAVDLCHSALLHWERTVAQESCTPVGIDGILLVMNALLLLHCHRRWARYGMVAMALMFAMDMPTKLYDATFPAPQINKVDPTYAMVDEEIVIALEGMNLKPGGSVAWVAYWGCATTSNVDACEKQFPSTFEAGVVPVTFKSLDHFIPCYRDPPNPLKAQDYQCYENIRIRVKDKQSIPGWSRTAQPASVSQQVEANDGFVTTEKYDEEDADEDHKQNNSKEPVTSVEDLDVCEQNQQGKRLEEMPASVETVETVSRMTGAVQDEILSHGAESEKTPIEEVDDQNISAVAGTDDAELTISESNELDTGMLYRELEEETTDKDLVEGLKIDEQDHETMEVLTDTPMEAESDNTNPGAPIHPNKDPKASEQNKEKSEVSLINSQHDTEPDEPEHSDAGFSSTVPDKENINFLQGAESEEEQTDSTTAVELDEEVKNSESDEQRVVIDTKENSIKKEDRNIDFSVSTAHTFFDTSETLDDAEVNEQKHLIEVINIADLSEEEPQEVSVVSTGVLNKDAEQSTDYQEATKSDHDDDNQALVETIKEIESDKKAELDSPADAADVVEISVPISEDQLVASDVLEDTDSRSSEQDSSQTSAVEGDTQIEKVFVDSNTNKKTIGPNRTVEDPAEFPDAIIHVSAEQNASALVDNKTHESAVPAAESAVAKTDAEQENVTLTETELDNLQVPDGAPEEITIERTSKSSKQIDAETEQTELDEMDYLGASDSNAISGNSIDTALEEDNLNQQGKIVNDMIVEMSEAVAQITDDSDPVSFKVSEPSEVIQEVELLEDTEALDTAEHVTLEVSQTPDEVEQTPAMKVEEASTTDVDEHASVVSETFNEVKVPSGAKVETQADDAENQDVNTASPTETPATAEGMSVFESDPVAETATDVEDVSLNHSPQKDKHRWFELNNPVGKLAKAIKQMTATHKLKEAILSAGASSLGSQGLPLKLSAENAEADHVKPQDAEVGVPQPEGPSKKRKGRESRKTKQARDAEVKSGRSTAV